MNKFTLIFNYIIFKVIQRNLVKRFLKLKKVSFEKDIILNGMPFILNKGKLEIEGNVIINSALRWNPIGGMNRCVFWVKQGGLIRIKEGARISNSSFVAAVEITIGANTYVGGDCRIYDTDFHSVYPDLRMRLDDRGVSRSISIGDNCFIGASSIILKGVTIGDRSVVGAGSVVASSIPPGEIWAGNPARFLKKIEPPVSS